MKTNNVTFDDLSASVLAVPPLARDANLELSQVENKTLIRHLEAGGITTLLYGGNANFYNVPISEYASTLEFLAEAALKDTWIVPSVGPDYGRMMDQAEMLRHMSFPAAMVLPHIFPVTQRGVEIGLSKFAQRLGRPIILYLKSENYLSPKAVHRLVTDGLVCGIKYAIVREDTSKDDYLLELLDWVDCNYMISGMGELPAPVHFRHFGMGGYTSGSVCIAPRASTQLLKSLKDGDFESAKILRAAFLRLENLRDDISPIRVLHDAITLAGIADMGPILPLLHNLEEEHVSVVQKAAQKLLAYDKML